MYREEMDSVGQFVEARCVVARQCHALAGELYREYQLWCERAGESALSQQRFGRELKDRGYSQMKDQRGNRAWSGVGLAVEDSV